MMKNCISLTGAPGVGKTTLVKRLVENFEKNSINFEGFFTEEVRDSKNQRIGFDIISFTGKRGILARHNDITKKKSKFRVGQYHVFLEDLEDISRNTLSNTQSSKLIIIDEIGNMELMSKYFCDSLENLLTEVKNNCLSLIVTVPLQNRRNHAVIDEIKMLKSGILYTLTKQNRDKIYDEILENCLKLKI